MTPNEWMTSSHCSGGDCIELIFKTSSFCYGHGDCVEVARPDGHVLVRDTKDRTRPPAAFPSAEWVAFVAAVRAREFER